MKYYSPKPAKQQASSLRTGQFRHVLRVSAITGRMREQDVMQLWVTHSTGIRGTELALLEIRDMMHPSGQLRGEVYLRGAITKHAHPRVIYLSHPKTVAAVGPVAYRQIRGWMLGLDGNYRGFHADECLVLTHKGRARELAFKPRQISTGVEMYRCCDVLRQAGITKHGILARVSSPGGHRIQ